MKTHEYADYAKDERDGCRSLVCDSNGIIIAESCFRCMICSAVLDSISEAKTHYHDNHIDGDYPNGNHTSDDPILFAEDDYSMDMTQSDEEESSLSQSASNSLTFNSYDAINSQLYEPQSKGSSSSRKKGISGKALSPDKLGLVKVQTQGTNGTCTIKSGYITCPVCSCTKFYTTLQRRYGQFSCVGCYRFFKEFLTRPKRFSCSTLGDCPLDQRTKCKACWIKTCTDVYVVDEMRKELLLANRPQKKGGARSPSSRASNGSSGVSSALENISPQDLSGSNLPLALTMGAPDPDQDQQLPSDMMPHDQTSEDQDQDDGLQEEGDVDQEFDDGAVPSPMMALEYNMTVDESGGKMRPGNKTPQRRKTSGRIKNWCCLKCTNCLADDCGRCINCLDRPKFGGPFIRKQRCLYKKCLMKMTSKSPQQ